MTEHKFTDEEVIKALECCQGEGCADCPMIGCPTNNCVWDAGFALDLINRQKAEIERLEKENTAFAKRFYKEGVKDLAEKLKKYTIKPEFPWDDFVIPEIVIDKVVEELVGAKNENN